MTFGEKLQSLRAREGLSQDALAEALDVSRQAVSKWERDEAMPEAEKIVRISRRFGVTTDYLLLEDAPERPTADSRERLRSLGAWIRDRGWLLGVPVALYGLWRLLEFVSGTWGELMRQVDQRTFWEGMGTYLFHNHRGSQIAADLGWIAAGLTAAAGGARIAGHIRWYHAGTVLAAGGAALALASLLWGGTMLSWGVPAGDALSYYGGDILHGVALVLVGLALAVGGRRLDSPKKTES
ncbi:helix-turn-helix domain-containing protein [Dysosmobacter sp.]|uniref:helix-turn-helix domain-containing protein n=1 Tax=Dysosmobacter sp. TaxID=2591382 RepID=UPI003FD7711C